MATTKASNPSHLLVPVAVLSVVLLMVVPLPPMLLDLLLSVDIGLAVVLLLTSIYVKSPVEFSVFPSLLLLLTMIRLSLNIASTRLVLLHGGDGTEAAGSVIQAFGQFVVGGNFVVGVVIFLVLIAIQYIVINHGAVRISEVTARFTLDAMPGRQMAIDADLNAGIIDEREARDRRNRIRREADFYGAMDGAIRFTQRDALAAVLITFVNIVAGLITTRAASESHLGEEVSAQLFARSRPLLAAAGLLLLLAAIPGLPKLSFVIVASLLAMGAYAMREQASAAPAEVVEGPAPGAADAADAPTVGVEPLSVEVGYALVGLVDEKQGGTLLTRVRAIRRQIATETGVIVPPVRIADNLQLGPRGYTILVKGVEVARGELYADRLLAINPGTASRTLEGVQTREPAFGLPALWVSSEQRDAATAAGYTVVDATTALSTHLSETIRTFLPDLLSRQQTKEMLDQLASQSPKLVEDLVPKVVAVGEVQRVLRQLLRERVPVRDLATILESLADSVTATKDPDAIVEHVRASIGRAICRPYQNDKGELPVIGVLPVLEEKLLASIVRTEQGAVLALDPVQAQGMASKIARAIEQAMAQPVLLCSPALRPHLWRLFARVLPHLGVLSHNEVPPHVPIVPLATLD